MRLFNLLAVAAIVTTFGLAAPESASADGMSEEKVVHHRAYYSRYRHVYRVSDPYGYAYELRGYYPYYNSGYWRPAWEMRGRRANFVLPPYYKAWGYPKKHYHHRAWHRAHHGRHYRWHW